MVEFVANAILRPYHRPYPNWILVACRLTTIFHSMSYVFIRLSDDIPIVPLWLVLYHDLTKNISNIFRKIYSGGSRIFCLRWDVKQSERHGQSCSPLSPCCAWWKSPGGARCHHGPIRQGRRGFHRTSRGWRLDVPWWGYPQIFHPVIGLFPHFVGTEPYGRMMNCGSDGITYIYIYIYTYIYI